VTDEPLDLVKAWIAKNKPTYPIAIAGGSFEKLINVPHFPYCAVVGPDGLIAYAGNSGGEHAALEAQLGKSKKAPLFPKSLAKVSRMLQSEPAKCYAELKKMIDGGKLSAEDKVFADDFVGYLENQAKQALEEARSLQGKGHFFKAHHCVAAYATAQPPFPTTNDAAAMLKEMEALPEFKKEMTGGAEFAAAEACEADGEYLDAFDAYKAVSKQYPGTKIASLAYDEALRIQKAGLPGFEPACPRCNKARSACEKHAKTVKL
jgi:hypothetical protein